MPQGTREREIKMLKRIIAQIKRYALVPEPQTEPLCLEAFVDGCPVRLQIGLPGQSLDDLHQQVSDDITHLDQILASVGRAR